MKECCSIVNEATEVILSNLLYWLCMFAKIKTFVRRIAAKLPPKQWAIVGLATIVLWGLGSVFIPHTINYRYASQSCGAQLVLLPSLRRSPSEAKFLVQYQGGWHLGKWHVFSTHSCAVAVSAPQQGTYGVRSSAFGLLLPTYYRVHVSKAPALQRVPKQTEVAITKPLQLTLDAPDAVYTYHIVSKDNRQKCSISGTALLCKLDKLALAQGTENDISIVRSFADKTSTRLATSRVKILPAVVVTGQSIQPNETVYTLPKELTITTDKTLAAAQATLVEVDGNKAKPIETKLEVRGTTIALVFAADLPREKSFKIIVQSAESTTGTTLTEPYVYTFTTSGGPKVAGVNIGQSGTATDATIRIAFDQVLAAGQDITKFVSIEGVPGTISYGDKEVHIRLSGATRCAAFSLKVNPGIRGENGLAGTAAWNYVSRTNCRSTSIIGYSLKGKPIVAYYYGSGGTTILFSGGIHGTEASGSYILQDWIAHLDTNAYKIPAGRQVVVVPQANPDGLAANTRDNARGVNIDRNFPTSNWRKDINSANGYRPGGGGESAGSEPETKALMSLTNQLRPRLEISYHAQGSLVGASACSASAAIARTYASNVGYATMIGTAEETMGYELTGEYEEWICEAYGTPAILIELPNRTSRYLSSHLSTMWQMVSY